MRLLIQFAMIFFGTLFAAGLLALGDPSGSLSSSRDHRAATTGALPAGDWWHDLTAATQPPR